MVLLPGPAIMQKRTENKFRLAVLFTLLCRRKPSLPKTPQYNTPQETNSSFYIHYILSLTSHPGLYLKISVL